MLVEAAGAPRVGMENDGTVGALNENGALAAGAAPAKLNVVAGAANAGMGKEQGAGRDDTGRDRTRQDETGRERDRTGTGQDGTGGQTRHHRTSATCR
jgi:hypothetical protein